MPSPERCRKEYDKIVRQGINNIRFDDLCALLEMHGWTCERKARSNHYIYAHPNYEGIVNIPKPHDGSHVKPNYSKHALEAIAEVADYD